MNGMPSSFFMNMSVSHFFLSKTTVKGRRKIFIWGYSCKGLTMTCKYTNKLVERGTKTLQIAVCLKRGFAKERKITTVAWATPITDSRSGHKARACWPREKELARGRLLLWERLKREVACAVRAVQAYLLAALCLITAALAKTINLLLQSWICLTYLDDRGKPGVNTLTFSSFILISVLIGWPELLSMLWWYNPRDRFPKISNVL